VLREQRDLSQAMLGRKAKMAQERISILEDPNADTKPTLKTLLRLASSFDVGLDVRFVRFGTVLDRSVNTDSIDLEVPPFDEELPNLEKELAETEAQILQAEAQLVPSLSAATETGRSRGELTEDELTKQCADQDRGGTLSETTKEEWVRRAQAERRKAPGRAGAASAANMAVMVGVQ
jgi:transcriptional regulator with XRE-family HTH domain